MQKPIAENEKRKHIRLHKEFETNISTQSLENKKVITKDISKGGVYIEVPFSNLESPLTSFLCLRNDKIHLNIHINNGLKSICGVGIVKWSKEIKSTNNNGYKKYGLGIQFIDPPQGITDILPVDTYEHKAPIDSSSIKSSGEIGQPPSANPSYDEKRTHQRIELNAVLNVTLRNTSNNSTDHVLGSIINLSEGGICFTIDSLLQHKATIPVLIDFSPLPYRFNASIEILWGGSKDKVFVYGGSFKNIDEDNYAILCKVLNSQNKVVSGHAKNILSLIDAHIVSQIKNKVSGFFVNEVTEHIKSLIEVEAKLIAIQNEQKLIQGKIYDLSENIAKKGNELELLINHKFINKEIKKRFRALIGTWAYQSPLIKRAFEKPRGYAGDYQMIEYVYDNKPASTTNEIGYYYDNYFLTNEYATAVRNRKDLMKKFLRDSVEETGILPFSVLNLACGSCREIKELITEINIPPEKQISFTCIDQDEESLAFSHESLQSLPSNIKINLLKENILNFLSKPDKYAEVLGKHDLVYSIGLADYFPDGLLKRFIRFCFNVITPNGKFAFAHKDRDKYIPIPHDWFCDWTFYPRNEDKLINMIKESGINDFSVKVEREDSGIIFFVTLTNKN